MAHPRAALCLVAVLGLISMGACDEVNVDAGGSTSGACDPAVLEETHRQLANALQDLAQRTTELEEAEARVVEAEAGSLIVNKHFERRIADLQAELQATQARLEEQLMMSKETEERLHDFQAKAEAGGGSADSAECDCSAQWPGADPRRASTQDMREEIDRLFHDEQARQRRLQHDDADSADNGPKEISIHCAQKVSVSIVDLDVAQRDRNECMVLNVNGPDVSSRLVLFCDGTNNMGSDQDDL